MTLTSVSSSGTEAPPPEALNALGHDVGGAYLAFFWLRTAVVVFLIYAIHLAFGRADVQALFKKELPPDAGDSDDGSGNDDDSPF